MPEFIRLLPPDEARGLLLSRLDVGPLGVEAVPVTESLRRVCAAEVRAPHALPQFPRSTVDGYAVRARDTFGASDSAPAYLQLTGEIQMGDSAQLTVGAAQCAIIHTGGMLPLGATAVVMLEHAQRVASAASTFLDSDAQTTGQVEVFRAVAEAENTIAIGEDIAAGRVLLAPGQRIGPAAVGAMLALGVLNIAVARKPRIGIISTGDEVVEPSQQPHLGQVRDVNSYTLSAVIQEAGGEPRRYGIVRDEFEALRSNAADALSACDAIVLTAGSSASTRDMTAAVVDALGSPGVLVHGISTRPGKPTILGVCAGKAVVGLPGNPVSALVNGFLFVAPTIERLLGALPTQRPAVRARLATNLPSEAGREDWWPVKLVMSSPPTEARGVEPMPSAEPIFGKSNLIATLAMADGIVKVPADATGLAPGTDVDVIPL